jgi:hypothetical protein
LAFCDNGSAPLEFRSEWLGVSVIELHFINVLVGGRHFETAVNLNLSFEDCSVDGFKRFANGIFRENREPLDTTLGQIQQFNALPLPKNFPTVPPPATMSDSSRKERNDLFLI